MLLKQSDVHFVQGAGCVHGQQHGPNADRCLHAGPGSAAAALGQEVVVECVSSLVSFLSDHGCVHSLAMVHAALLHDLTFHPVSFTAHGAIPAAATAAATATIATAIKAAASAALTAKAERPEAACEPAFSTPMRLREIAAGAANAALASVPHLSCRPSGSGLLRTLTTLGSAQSLPSILSTCGSVLDA